MESVVRIHFKGFRGSGFLVYVSQDAGLILTCRHVVAAALAEDETQTVEIFFPSGNRFEASIVEQNKDTDLALLKYFDPNNESPDPLPFFKPWSTIHDSGRVDLIAYFAMNNHSVPTHPGISSGQITGPPTSAYTFNNISCIVSNETDRNGTSGGALMKQDCVIGIHTSGFTGARYAISLQVLQETLVGWTYQEDSCEITEMLDTIILHDGDESTDDENTGSGSS